MTDTNQKPVAEPQEFTLETAQKWLQWVEEAATAEQDLGFATRFILGNLILHLSRAGLMDGPGFLRHLRNHVHPMEPNEQLATLVMLDGLLAQLPSNDESEGENQARH
jgi:hypothetical protein